MSRIMTRGMLRVYFFLRCLLKLIHCKTILLVFFIRVKHNYETLSSTDIRLLFHKVSSDAEDRTVYRRSTNIISGHYTFFSMTRWLNYYTSGFTFRSRNDPMYNQKKRRVHGYPAVLIFFLAPLLKILTAKFKVRK